MKQPLSQALPSLDLGLSPPRPPGLAVGEVRGIPRGNFICCYQKNDEWMLVEQKQHMSYSQNSSGGNPKRKSIISLYFCHQGKCSSVEMKLPHVRLIKNQIGCKK